MEKMGPSPILSIIYAVSIGIMPNFKGGNNGYGLKNVTCKQTLRSERLWVQCLVYVLVNW